MNLSISKIRGSMADALNRVAYGGERIVLERRGKGVAALVSLDDLELLQELEDRADVEAARKAKAQGGKPIPLDQVLAELGMQPKAAKGQRKQAR